MSAELSTATWAELSPISWAVVSVWKLAVDKAAMTDVGSAAICAEVRLEVVVIGFLVMLPGVAQADVFRREDQADGSRRAER